MKGNGPKSEVLATETLHIENKTLHIDLKENAGGKFLQIAEISNDRRSTVVIPFPGIDDFVSALSKIVEGGKEVSE